MAALPTLALVGLSTVGITSASGATIAGSAARAPHVSAVVVTGPNAASTVRQLGGHDVRSTDFKDLAVADVTAGQAASLRARGLHVVADAPVTLDADDTTSETATDDTSDAAPASDQPTSDESGGTAPATSDNTGDAAPADSTQTDSADAATDTTAATNAATDTVSSARRSVRTHRAAAPRPVKRLSPRQLVALNNWRGLGAGVTVAVIDSGVDEVPGLAGRVVDGANFTDESFHDRYGHGTFDAGLIAGDGTGPDGEPTGIVGVAPKAHIVSVKVADSLGRSTVGQVALGLAWVIAHRADYGIDVANLSMSTAVPMSYDVNPLNALAEAAWFSGVAVVVSSGNGGRNTVNSAPANDPFVITVGSVWDHNTKGKYDDTISPFTNAGTTIDGFSKPEILAPGQHLQSTLPDDTILGHLQTVTGLPAGYGQLSGTSMATAVASGLVALLREARPSLSTDQVKGALISTLRKHDEPSLQQAVHRAGRVTANVGLRPSMALAAAYAQLFEHTTDYASVDWNAVDWRAVAWDQATWTNVDWTAATWSSATWAEATWGSASWASVTWASASWANASWANASWANASWADASWSTASWSTASWANASWADAAPSAA